MLDFTNKVILVTGASRGIGQAIAHSFAESGATVIGTATTEQGAKAISDTLESMGNKGRGAVLNLTDGESINALVALVEKDYGAINILVNNAAITQDNLMLRMSDEEWDSVIQTNLTGVFRMTRACIKSMFRARWGRVINISSVVGFAGNAGQANYCASKAGLVGFSKALGQELASRKVTINTVAPGFIKTDMTDKLPDAIKQGMLKAIPMKRFGEPQDIAHAVLFLASEYASYMTGQCLHINGGMYMA